MVSDPKIYNPAISLAGTPKLSAEIISPTADGTPLIKTSPGYEQICQRTSSKSYWQTNQKFWNQC